VDNAPVLGTTVRFYSHPRYMLVRTGKQHGSSQTGTPGSLFRRATGEISQREAGFSVTARVIGASLGVFLAEDLKIEEKRRGMPA